MNSVAVCAVVAGRWSEYRSVASAVRTAEPSPRESVQVGLKAKPAVAAEEMFVSLWPSSWVPSIRARYSRNSSSESFAFADIRSTWSVPENLGPESQLLFSLQ